MIRILQTGKSVANITCNLPLRRSSVRYFTNPQGYDGIVLGAYTDGEITLANTSTHHIQSSTRNKILGQLKRSNFKKVGDVRLLYGVGDVDQVAVVSLGNKHEATQDRASIMETARSAVSTIKEGLFHTTLQYA